MTDFNFFDKLKKLKGEIMSLIAERVKTRMAKIEAEAIEGKRKAGKQKVRFQEESKQIEIVEEPIKIVEEPKTLNI